MAATRPASFITDSPAEFLKCAANFLHNRIEDAIKVVPEIIEFKEQVDHLVRIIPKDLIEETMSIVLAIRCSQQESMYVPPSEMVGESGGRGGGPRRGPFRRAMSVLFFGYDANRGGEGRGDGDYTNNNQTEYVPLGHWTDPNGDVDLQDTKNAIVWKIIKQVDKANQRVNDFLKKEDQVRSLDSNIAWYLKDRPFYAKELREFCQRETNSLRLYLNDLVIHLQLGNMCRTQENRGNQLNSKLKDQMTEDTFRFWDVYFGNAVCVQWRTFRDAYELLYGKFVPSDMAFIKRILVSKAHALSPEELTVYGFIGVTRQYGFPFPKDIFSKTSTTLEPDEISEEKRMHLTKMTMDLVRDFSDEKMRNHLVTIYSWYSRCNRDGLTNEEKKKAMESRADEWALIMREKRAIDTERIELPLEDKHAQAERVDLARRAIYFFYEQFMVMWRVGGVTRDVLKDIDFPGKGRIRDFLKFVGPLDHANYYLLVKNMDRVPEERDYTPAIYKFMKEYLKILESQSKERKALEEANNADRPYR
ncbi:hypothetical protein BDA99DRAFT_555226 [Phascolomyces articulosus]|uniref:Uncharacterized protein n=1 Tax=Phascolomyces articulosus TaxID=60185 RepID=A0AAD5K928_9FUNG|nr:hypothetical protein BDA99DRAFT_555226 [Phascolomyces articulosus]